MREYEGGYDPSNLHYWAKNVGAVRDHAVARLTEVVGTAYNVSQAMAGLVDVDVHESVRHGAVITALCLVGVVFAFLKLVIASNILITVIWAVVVFTWCLTSVFLLSAMATQQWQRMRCFHDVGLQQRVLPSLPCSATHSLASIRNAVHASSAQACSLINNTVAAQYPRCCSRCQEAPTALSVCRTALPPPTLPPPAPQRHSLQTFANSLYSPASSGMSPHVVEDVSALSEGVAALNDSLATIQAAVNCSYVLDSLH
ncbi:hypothetical protein CLOP_g17714, partial [Closterium sp. NIES-67]